MRKYLPLKAMILLALGLAIAGPVSAADTSTALYTATITITNSGSALTNFAAPASISAGQLIDDGFIESDALNTVIQDVGTDVASMPGTDALALEGAVADDGGVLTTETTAANNATVNDMTLLPATPVVDDAYYFGMDNPGRILTLNTGTAGVGTWTIAWEYFNGSTYAAVSNLTDGTAGLTVVATQKVVFDMPSDWAEDTVDGITAFFLRARVSAFTSVTTQPLGTQAFYETGQWWVYVDTLGSNAQKQFDLSLGGGTDFITRHQVFVGAAGIVTADDASMELGATYVVEIEGFINTDSGANKDLLLKTDVIRIYVSTDQEITLEIKDGVSTNTATVTGIASGEYEVKVISDGTTALLVVEDDAGVVDANNTTALTLTDNANSWNWGTNGSVLYFERVRVTLPLIDLDFNDATWGAGTHTATVATGDQLELEERGTATSGCDITMEDWVPVSCGVGADVFITSADFQDGNWSLVVRDTTVAQSTWARQRIVASVGQEWSISARCFQDGINDADLQILFLDAAFAVLSTASTNTFLTCDAAWGDIAVSGQTAPATTASMEIRWIQIGNTPASSRLDNVVACICAVAPSFPDASNLALNPSFEEIYAVSGNRVSPDFDVSTVTDVEFATIAWEEITVAGETITVETSIDDQSSWQAAINGGSISGISVGDDLSVGGGVSVNTRTTLGSNGQASTPAVVTLQVAVADSTDLGVLYDLNTTPAVTITDRSPNTNTGTLSYPTTPATLADAVINFASTRQTVAVRIVPDTPSVASIVGSGNELDFTTQGTETGSTFAFFDLFNDAAVATGIPVNLFWIILATTAAIVVGGAVVAFTTSLMYAAVAMGIIILGVGLIGTGILPLWVLAIYGFIAAAFLTFEKRVFA